ncbi:MAG: hypothetical protein AABY13_00685, partial [Nanoarchaeota archaeon]
MKPSKLAVYIMAGVLALLSVLSFLTVLPPLGEFVLRAFAIVFLCILLYYTKIADVLFGVDNKPVTLAIIASCLLLSVRPIIEGLLAPLPSGFLYTLLLSISNSISDVTTYAVGTVVFAVLAVVVTLTITPRAPSVLAMMGEQGRIKRLDGYAIRSVLVFFVLAGFYILVFDIILQWAGIIASSATIIAIIAWLLHTILHPGSAGTTLRKFVLFIESIDESIFGNVVRLFHDRTTVLFGIAALLAFYPLSDLGVFLIPYITNIPNTLSSTFTLGTHTPLAALAYDAFNAGYVQGTFASVAYILNALAAVIVLFLPALYWYRMFRKRTLTLTPIASAIFLAGATCFLLAPAFTLGRLSTTDTNLVGVDIMTRPLAGSPIVAAVLFALCVGAATYLLARRFTVQLSLAAIALTLVFLARYMMLYFLDVWQ